MQLAAYLNARVPERDQPQNFDLAWREGIIGDGTVQGIQPRRDSWADELLTARGGANGLRKLTVGQVLGDEPERPCGERALCEHWVLIHRHHDDLCVRRLLTQAADRLYARPARHVQVKDQDLRLMALDMVCDGRQVVCFGDHLDTVLVIEEK